MKKRLICAAAAALLAAGAFADRVRAVHPRYDTGGWHANASAWEDNLAPDSSKDYVIDSNVGYKSNGSIAYGIRFGGASDSANVFGGNSLQIGVSGGSQVRLIYNCNGSYRINFPRDGLVLENGILCSWTDATAIGVDGKVTVTAPKASPFVIEGQKSIQNWDLTGPLVSSDSAGLVFRRESSGSSTSVPTLWFGFDGSEYLGDITVGWESANKSRNATTGVSFRDNASCAGHIVLNPSLGNGIKFQSTTTAYTNGSMTVHGNQMLTINNKGSKGSANVNSILVVTNSFTVDEGAVIAVAAGNAGINTWGQYQANGTTMPFLTVPVDSNVSESNFMPVYTNMSTVAPPLLPQHDIVMTVDGTTKTFALRRRAYYQMESNVLKYPISGRSDLFTFWTEDREADYYNKNDVSRTYETPNVENAEYVAKSLVLHEANNLCIAGRTLTIPDLRLIGSSQLFVKSSGSYANTVLRGRFGVWNRASDGKKVVALAGCASSSVRANLEIAADVWGPGDLEVKPTGNGKNGILALSGDNSKWTGGVSVEGNASQSIFLKAASVGALGAPLAAFRANAVELKPFGYLTAADGVTLADTMRGITTTGGGIHADEGTTFSVMSRITYGGTLVKSGTGTVALGGASDVSGGNAALDVREGYVKPLATNCLDGVALSFAAGSGLLFDASQADGDGIGRYGISNPTLAEGATLRVKVAFDSEPAQGVADVPICTVAAANADSLAVRTVVEKPRRGFSADVRKRANGDGTVTLVAHVHQAGMAVFVR